MIRFGLAFCAAVGALLTAGCVMEEPSAWQRLPDSPLSPREYQTAHWTGEEVLLIGGSDAPPCPPNAQCIAPKTPPLADGAAFDPQTRTWRRIADAPVPFEFARTVQIGDTVYVATSGNDTRPGAPPAFLAYDIGRDRWTTPPLPLGRNFEGGIVEIPGRIVAYPSSDEQGEQPDLAFDPATGAWTELPADPLSPSSTRDLHWNGDELVLRAYDLVENPTKERGAAYDPDTGSWRELSAAELNRSTTVGTVDGTPLPPSAYDEIEPWLPTLSNPPRGQDDFGDGPFATALFTPERSYYFRRSGWAFDAASETWTEIPRLGYEQIDSPNVRGRRPRPPGVQRRRLGRLRGRVPERDVAVEPGAGRLSPRRRPREPGPAGRGAGAVRSSRSVRERPARGPNGERSGMAIGPIHSLGIRRARRQAVMS